MNHLGNHFPINEKLVEDISPLRVSDIMPRQAYVALTVTIGNVTDVLESIPMEFLTDNGHPESRSKHTKFEP